MTAQMMSANQMTLQMMHVHILLDMSSSASSSAPAASVLRPVAALRTFFSPPAVTPTAGPVEWFAAQRSDAAWSDGAGRGDVQASAPRGIGTEAAGRGPRPESRIESEPRWALDVVDPFDRLEDAGDLGRPAAPDGRTPVAA
jgi:hypothetical protein